MVNKTGVRKEINWWLKRVKLAKGEDFSIYITADGIKITVCNERGEYREDYRRRKCTRRPAVPR